MNAAQTSISRRAIVERKYKQLLQRVVTDLRRLLRSAATAQQITAILNQYARSRTFHQLAETAAEKMITATMVGQRATWRAAAMESTRAKMIYQALRHEQKNSVVGLVAQAIVSSNSQLIQTVPRYVAQKLSPLAADLQMRGLRPAEIASRMAMQAPQLAKRQLMLIARTESAKAASALMEARCAALRLDWYVWYSCKDERVRSTHGAMHGVYCRWSEPPNPEKLFGDDDSHGAYHPGGIWNCRCIALPVVDENDIKFPCRVHFNGKIHKVHSIKAFKKLTG